jgi:hypothetical protein
MNKLLKIYKKEMPLEVSWIWWKKMIIVNLLELQVHKILIIDQLKVTIITMMLMRVLVRKKISISNYFSDKVSWQVLEETIQAPQNSMMIAWMKINLHYNKMKSKIDKARLLLKWLRKIISFLKHLMIKNQMIY